MFAMRGHEDHVAWREAVACVAVLENAGAAHDDVDLVAGMRGLIIAAARGVEADLQGAVFERYDPLLLARTRERSNDINEPEVCHGLGKILLP